MIIINSSKRVRPNWEEQKTRLRLMFPRLKDEDVDFSENESTKMLQHLELKLAIRCEELKEMMEDGERKSSGLKKM